MPSLLEEAIAAGTLNAEIIMPGKPTPTVPAAAEALGVPEEQILKSLLFLDPQGHAVLAIATGSSKVDRVKLAQVAGVERLKLAPPDEVFRRTGYPVGGAAPVCHTTPLHVIVDERLLQLDTVFGGGGTAETMLKITPREIIRQTGATIASICASTIVTSEGN